MQQVQKRDRRDCDWRQGEDSIFNISRIYLTGGASSWRRCSPGGSNPGAQSERHLPNCAATMESSIAVGRAPLNISPDGRRIVGVPMTPNAAACAT